MEVLAGYESGCYVQPTIIAENHCCKMVQSETFAPFYIYIMKYSGDVEEAIEIQNEVAQGLSSAIYD